MKRIIRLTESDLVRIVKKIINENDSMDDLIHRTLYSGFKSWGVGQYAKQIS